MSNTSFQDVRLQELITHIEAPDLAKYISWLEEHGDATMSDFLDKRDAAWSAAMAGLGIAEEAVTVTAITDALRSYLDIVERDLQQATELQDISSEAEWEMLLQIIQREVPEALTGRFVKESVLTQLLVDHPPEAVLRHLGYASIEECLASEDILEIYSALRFSESGDWMSGLLASYSALQPDDFEERAVRFIRLQPERWWELAAPFAKKKRHHFSHLKEAGVIFTYPSPNQMQQPQPLYVLVAMAFHYVYEVHFYTEFFRHHIDSVASTVHVGKTFIEVLEGDVDLPPYSPTSLPIVQQYHRKLTLPPKFIYLPHVMPEAMHWNKAIQMVISLASKAQEDDVISFMKQCFAVAKTIDNQIVSLNLADVILSYTQDNADEVLKNGLMRYHYIEEVWNALLEHWIDADVLRKSVIQQLDKKSIDLSELV